MATKVTLPFLGQTMEEGTITKWLKQEGESVEKGEPLLEVMTDKANMEVEAPASGVVRKIVAAEGATVPVKDLIAIIGSADEPIGDLIDSNGRTAEGAPAEVPEPVAVASASSAAETATPQTTAGGRIFASPRAKKTAAEQGIDIALLAGKGTGPDGRIVEKDVIAFAAVAPAAPKITPLAGKIAADMGIDAASLVGTGPSGKIRRDDVVRAIAPKQAGKRGIGRTIPYSGVRKAVGENVAQSIRTSPHVTLVTEVDMTAATELRNQLLPEIQKRYGTRLSVTAIVVKAAALAILDHPIVNSSLTDKEIIVHDDVHIGIATALDNGLVVPVVRDADRKELHEISEEIKTLAAKARAGNLGREEMQGGTFTVSNLAAFGIDVFNPIINPPQSAILGVCRAVQKPAIVGGQVQVRSMMNLCLSFDHRVMDGAPAAQYLARVKEILESPYLLLV